MSCVSVVIPVFNGEKYIEATLEGVFGQTHPDIEVIVVDDGSCDATLDILSRYGDRVRVIQQQNSGSAAARNRGLQEATGDWIAFVDADDIWLPEKLEKQLRECGTVVWSHTSSVFMGGVNDGKRDSDFTVKQQGNVLAALACGNFIVTSTVLAKRQALLDAGGFDVSLRSIQDWDLWMRLAAKHELGYLDQALTRYRVHSSSASRSTRKTLPNHMKVIDKIFAPDGAAASVAHLKGEAKAKSCTLCSFISEEEGDYGFALKCAWLACRYQPVDPARWIRLAKASVKYVLFLFGIKR